jgi:hypothetical protein
MAPPKLPAGSKVMEAPGAREEEIVLLGSWAPQSRRVFRYLPARGRHHTMQLNVCGGLHVLHSIDGVLQSNERKHQQLIQRATAVQAFPAGYKTLPARLDMQF